jgi:hypothetical protein
MATPGDRFSQLYIAKGAPVQDSARARIRCGAEFEVYVDDKYFGDAILSSLAYTLNTELAAKLPQPYYVVHIARYWEKCPLPDFLDSLTFAFRAVAEHKVADYAKAWPAFIGRVFHEENLGYKIDSKGVVHYRVDEEYESNVSSALTALDAAKYSAVRTAFERARADLSKAVPDALDSVRSLFEAAESLFKIVTGSGSSLDAGEVKRKLAGFVAQQMKDSDPIAKSSTAKLTEGFADWVNACHPYRHGHDQPDAVEPPMSLAVALMSTGASYIRWIATLDQAAA